MRCISKWFRCGPLTQDRGWFRTSYLLCIPNLDKGRENYSNLEPEALVVIFGMKKFHQCIDSRQFIPETDHKPLESFFNEKKATPAMAAARIQRWALTLAAYNYTVKYKPEI